MGGMYTQRWFVVVLGLAIIFTASATAYIYLSNEDASPEARTEVTDLKEEARTIQEPHPAAVVSSHTLATDAGVAMLEAGGTAADAAVAVAAVLSVVEPWFSSILGGGTWALYYDAVNDVVTSLDGVGPTGSLATPSNYAQRAGNPGMHQANVPGAFDGWMLWLLEYGKLDLATVLAPAIEIARAGFPVSREMQIWLDRQADVTLARPESARIYAPEGTLLRAGDIVYQRDMANTLEAIVLAAESANGREAGIQAARDYFYRGPIAEAIVAFSDAQNGYLTRDDFTGYRAEIVSPLALPYSDNLTVYQNPPNSHGITMLLALNILKGYDLSSYAYDSPEAIHLTAEAIKLAFADRYYHVGDPARVEVPIAALLSDAHRDRQRERIDMERARTWPIADVLEPLDPDIVHTTTFHVVDAEGNGAAVTTSLGAQFFVVGDTGIHINHRMRFLSLRDDDPNQVAPGFKVRHTSNPYMAFRDGQLYILGGNTGADTQPQGQVIQFLRVVEHGLRAQDAISEPRFVSTAFPSTVYSYQVRNTLQLEAGFPAETVSALRSKGHTVTEGEGTFGSAHMVVITDEGVDLGVESRTSDSKGWLSENSEQAVQELSI